MYRHKASKQDKQLEAHLAPLVAAAEHRAGGAALGRNRAARELQHRPPPERRSRAPRASRALQGSCSRAVPERRSRAPRAPVAPQGSCSQDQRWGAAAELLPRRGRRKGPQASSARAPRWGAAREPQSSSSPGPTLGAP
uniref:Uncharacterized protein n=1 Tax=Arundo donax TaxID=35708 RepID=A0A0A9DWE0_ARUDO